MEWRAEEGELRFRAGDVIDILDYEGEWWIGRLGQDIGEVPYNFLTYEGAKQQQYYAPGGAEAEAVQEVAEVAEGERASQHTVTARGGAARKKRERTW